MPVDEADACEVDAEGSPIALAEERTQSFANRKPIIGSTPIEEDTSHVLRLWGQSDQGVLINIVLAEGLYEAAADVGNPDVASRAESFSLDDIPADVLALTFGVDVRYDRVEVTTPGWSKTVTPFVLYHRTLWGTPKSNEVWLDMNEILKAL